MVEAFKTYGYGTPYGHALELWFSLFSIQLTANAPGKSSRR